MIANVFIIPYLQYSLVLGAKFVRVLLDNLSLISEPETLNSNNLNLIKHLTSNVWKTPGKNYFWWMCTTVNWCTFQADWRKCLNLKCSYIQQHLLLCRGVGGGAGAGAHVAERLVSILMMDHNYPGNILSSALPLCSGHHNPAVHTTSKWPCVVVV